MQREGDEIHVETDEARGGSTPNIVRWILAISLFAAIALLSVIWITGAATQGPSDADPNERARLLQEYGSRGGVLPSQAEGTDSIVGEDADELDAAEPGETSAPGTPPQIENEAADEAPPPEPAAT